MAARMPQRAGGKCAYTNCLFSRRQYPGLHYYRFPTQHPGRCQRWLQNSGNPALSALPLAQLNQKVLCEMHFEETAFINASRHRLVHDAVPRPFCAAGSGTVAPAPWAEASARSNYLVIYHDTGPLAQRPPPRQYRGKRAVAATEPNPTEGDPLKKSCVDDAEAKGWSRPAVRALIDLYRNHPVLYDNKHPVYHNKFARKDALELIAQELRRETRPHTVPDDVKAKLSNLRTQFASEQHKVVSGDGDDEPYTPTLWWFERMHFLRDYIVSRKSGTSEAPTPTSGASVLIKEEEVDINEDDVQCELMPTKPPPADHDDLEEAPRVPQSRLGENFEESFGDFVSQSMTQLADLQTRNKLKIQIMQAIADAHTEDDRNFGKYVTSALLKISGESVKAHAKAQITQVLCDAQLEDLRH